MERIKNILDKLISIIINPIIDFVRHYSSRRHFIKGDKNKLKLGSRVSLVNTIINVSSGTVEIGDDTIFGHNCILATGVHEFKDGMRKKIYNRRYLNKETKEVPTSGYDIKIGSGCWITSNVTIIGGVTIGDNVIVSAGSVVTKDVPSSVIIGGVPAKIIKTQ